MKNSDNVDTAKAKAEYARKYPKIAAWRAAGAVDPWTDELEDELAREIADDPDSDPEIVGPAMSFAEAHPALAASAKRLVGRPRKENAKVAVTLRVEPDVLTRLKARPDWRKRVDEALRKAAGL